MSTGADNSALLAQGRPEQLTSDQTIIELLNGAQTQTMGPAVPNGYPQMNGFATDAGAEPPKAGYYPQQYMYYPAVPPNGAILPRASGASDAPMNLPTVVPFVSPPNLERRFTLPHRGAIAGMAIPRGITMIAGGGFHVSRLETPASSLF